jgi:hypothetical protein
MSCCELFDFGRADLADRRMSTPLVIEHLDIVEQLPLGPAAARETIGELALERREERFQTVLS